jgi:hypothetical protein
MGVSREQQWQVGVEQQEVTSPTHATLALQGSDQASAGGMLRSTSSI